MEPSSFSPSDDVSEARGKLERDPERNYSEFFQVIDGDGDDNYVRKLLGVLVDKKKSLFGDNSTLVPEVDLSLLDVPTLSPSDKKGLGAEILKMSKLKKEYEIDEMMKQIEKNEQNLKRVNISISLSRENNDNFKKKAAHSKAQLDELVKEASEVGYADDTQIIMKIQKLHDDLDKIEKRMMQYQKLLDKQKALIIRKLTLQYNLTFFESIIHG